MATKLEFNLEEVCVSFLKRNRFYTVILSKLNKIKTESIPTAGVGFSNAGKLVLYYNQNFFEGLNLAEAQAVLEHEVLHVFFRHLYRLPPNKENPKFNKLKNLACDMAINQYLKDLPEGAVYPETYKLQKEMYAEWYFEELKKIQQDQDQKQKQSGGKGEGKGEGENPQDQDTLDDHEMWGKTIDENGKIQEASDSQAIDIEHEVDKIIRQAAKEMEGDSCIGKLPLNVQKELEVIRNPPKKHDWKRELKIFVNTVLTLSKKLSQKRVNRRLMGQVDYILPGKKKDRFPKLLLARDTSGSVFNDVMQKQFLDEMVNISKFCDVIVVDCDTEIHQKYHVRKVEDFKEYQGGGGTSFEPVFEEAKKLAVDGIIYLTDTYGSFPKKEDIGKFAAKTIWVTIDVDKVNIPFGRHVNIKEIK